MSDEETVKSFNCYQCGKSNAGVFFCDEVCHRKWGEAHPQRLKVHHTIAEIQTKLIEMAALARSKKLKNISGGSNDINYEVAQLIFG